MNKKILIVNYYEISKLPPVRNLVEVLLRNRYVVTLITIDEKEEYVIENSNFRIIRIKTRNNFIGKAIDFLQRKNFLRKLVTEEMGKHDVLWTTTDRTARELGNICKNYKHIMQLMELIEDMPLFPGQKIFKAKLDRIGRSAYQVVVPEYNRAQILATWWNLKKIPYILPNKPACMELDIKMPEEYVGIIEKVKSEKRKIVIYQGVIREERPLDCFIEAVEELGKDYCVYIMGEESEELKRLITKYPGIEHIPFIRPPFHLIATQYAHIGILSYVPYKDKKLHYSDLNALYCAPNKIYEYAGIGLPMIGNNIPGLKYTVEMWGMGQLFNGFSRREIANTIRKIEENYDEYKENCYKFYHDLSLDSIVKEILNDENDISE